MNLSREGAMELIGHEAIVLTRYLDSVGVWTIGVGHTRAAGEPNPDAYLGKLTLDEALKLFDRDVAKYVAAVNAAVRVKVTQAQFDALVSFHYNTGAIGRASLVKRLNAGDVAGAAAGLMEWVKPPEVTGRRRKEQMLFQSGRYSNGGMANIYPASASGHIQWNKPQRVDLRKALGLPRKDRVAETTTAGGIAAGGAIAGKAAHDSGASGWQVAGILLGIAILAGAAFVLIRKLRS